MVISDKLAMFASWAMGMVPYAPFSLMLGNT